MLAIVIPYFKSTFFEETLQSLANQTDQRFKVYIGDDASKEAPIFLLEKYKEKIDVIYHRFEENLGEISLTKQWERCIALTENEYWLMLLGDDDYISPNYVEAFYMHIREIDKLEIKVIHFAVQRLDRDGSFSEIYNHPKIEKAVDNFFRKYFGQSHASLTEQIFRKEAYLKHGFRELPLAWGSDDLAWLDFTDFGDIYGINDATAYFRISSENISRSGYKGAIKQETKYLLFKMLVENDLKKFTKEQRLKLLLHHERLGYRYHKVSLGFWIKMCALFIKEKEFVQIYKSTKKFLVYLKSPLD